MGQIGTTFYTNSHSLKIHPWLLIARHRRKCESRQSIDWYIFPQSSTFHNRSICPRCPYHHHHRENSLNFKWYQKNFFFRQNMYQNLISMTINCHLITWEYSLFLILSEDISWRSLTVTEHILVRRFRPAFDYTLVETLDLNKTIDGLLEWGEGTLSKTPFDGWEEKNNGGYQFLHDQWCHFEGGLGLWKWCHFD